MAREDLERVCYVFTFACVVGKTLKTPKLNPMADDTITQGRIGSLVSLVYICDVSSHALFFHRQCYPILFIVGRGKSLKDSCHLTFQLLHNSLNQKKITRSEEPPWMRIAIQ